jgi:hypothetical protein
LVFKTLRPLRLWFSNEGQGFLKLVGGLPTWCAGGFGDFATKDPMGSTEIIVARRPLDAMLLGVAHTTKFMIDSLMSSAVVGAVISLDFCWMLRDAKAQRESRDPGLV